MILLCRYPLIFEEISKNALELDYYHGVVQLVRTPSEKVTVSSLEVSVSLRVQLHFYVLLLHLRWFARESLLCLRLSMRLDELSLA